MSIAMIELVRADPKNRTIISYIVLEHIKALSSTYDVEECAYYA